MNGKCYEITDMKDGKVISLKINEKKVNLSKETPLNEVTNICDNFFNMIDFNRVIKSKEDIMKERLDNNESLSEEFQLLDLVGRYASYKFFNEPIIEMRKKFGNIRFDKKDILPIIENYYPDVKDSLDVARRYITFMRKEGIVEKRGQSQSSFKLIKVDIDEDEIKERRQAELDSMREG